MVKPCPAMRVPCFIEECKAGCKLRREPEGEHSIFCSHYNIVCRNIMCIRNKGCIGRSNDNIQPDVVQPRMKLMIATKLTRKCPVAVAPHDLCDDPDCVKGNECLDQKFGAIPEAKPTINVAAPTGLGTACNCPHDYKVCQMAECDAGNNCYLRRQSAPYSSGVVHQYKPAAPPCHQGMISIGWVNKAEILLGRNSAADNWIEEEQGKLALVIGLLGFSYINEQMIRANMSAQNIPGIMDLTITAKAPPNLVLDWPDFKAMKMERSWWDKLVDIISKLDGCVLIYCAGGHGRTGTVASIIASLAGLVPQDTCPVEWLRSVYCSHAVESNEQLDYIEAITGRKVTATAYKQPSFPTHKQVAPGVYISQKKKTSGSSVGKAKHKADRSYPQRLSIKKWKQWWRKVDKRGEYAAIATITRPKDIPDGTIFKIGKRSWSWCADEHIFLEYKQPKEADK